MRPSGARLLIPLGEGPLFLPETSAQISVVLVVDPYPSGMSAFRRMSESASGAFAPAFRWRDWALS